MRVCYFLQTHGLAAQIERLVQTLRRGSPDSLILIGHDDSASRLDDRRVGAARVLHSPGPHRRGHFSAIEPYLTAIEHLRTNSLDFDWLVYLSGQDYPTQPLATSEAFLARTPYDGFLTYWDVHSPSGGWGRSRRGVRRYLYRYRAVPGWARSTLRRVAPLVNDVQSLVHVHRTYGVRVGVRARSTPFEDSLVCYAGSAWSTLSRRCVEFLAESVRARPDLVEYYRHTVSPEESLVQTLLVNSTRFALAKDNLRYIDFTGASDGRPRTLTVADYETITRPRYHFARKFDLGRDAAVLNLLDRHLFGAPP